LNWGFFSQVVEAEAVILPEANFFNIQPSVNFQFVNATAGNDRLNCQVGKFFVCANAVSFIGFGTASFLFSSQGCRAKWKIVDVWF
jgi:hypothetical protein